MRIAGGLARLAMTERRTKMMNCGTEVCGEGAQDQDMVRSREVYGVQLSVNVKSRSSPVAGC